jgi:AcrR family transcriptional regulator
MESPTAPPDAPPTAPPTDGRLLRGLASRAAILDGAATVIRDQGVDGLTHRAVAGATGVPLARVSYHFPTVDDLLVAASGHFLAVFDERLAELAQSSRVGERSIVDACTDFLVELLSEGRDDFVAAVQVRIALHRRGLVTDDGRMLGIIGSFGASDELAEGVFAAMFGFATLAATSPIPVDRRRIRNYVRLVLGSMT